MTGLLGALCLGAGISVLAGGLAWSITSCSLRQCYPILDALVDSMAIAQEFRMLCLGKKMQVASSPPARRWGALGSSGLSKQPGHDRRLLCRQPPLPFALFLALFLAFAVKALAHNLQRIFGRKKRRRRKAD